ncbi:MAG: Scyllo-inosamine-4-phosphate amidinotransferase [Patescibacteria group bacterium]|nr:Scyllo-inosamine-4-phosphate amidinotransferase [Patescibacteria group bacterium]
MSGQTPIDRINLEGDFEPFVAQVAEAFQIVEPTGHTVIEVGYEDCNVVIDAKDNRYLAKMFAKTRKPEEVGRYVEIMEQVVAAGVSHPELLKTKTGDTVLSASGVSLVVMPFINGKTFFELDRAPNPAERRAVLEQAAKVNAIDYKPTYLFDSWAVPNIQAMFERVQQYVESDDLELAKKAMAAYADIPVNDLPHSFVHGDFTKTNVLLSDDGQIYILDFSVANYYPRIQELAVIVANLLHDGSDQSLAEKCQVVADEYRQFSDLTDLERQHLPAYALAAVAMEFLGAHQEKYINGNDTEETDYWLNVGREGLRREL